MLKLLVRRDILRPIWYTQRDKLDVTSLRAMLVKKEKECDEIRRTNSELQHANAELQEVNAELQQTAIYHNEVITT